MITASERSRVGDYLIDSPDVAQQFINNNRRYIHEIRHMKLMSILSFFTCKTFKVYFWQEL